MPKPFFFNILRVRRPSPFSEPPLTGLTQARLRGGEQILQVSVMMLLICATVHGASLNSSELI